MGVALHIQTLVNGPLATNCYVVSNREAKTMVVIDPGSDPDRVFGIAVRSGAKVDWILLTHGHYDHVAAARFLARKLPAPIAIQTADAPMLDVQPPAPWNSHFRLDGPISRELADGDELTTAGATWNVMHTPGHSPGSCCLLTEGILFSGDTLFANTVGRTDIPGGNQESLLVSIRQKLLVLPDDTRVLPGHGPATTIGAERAHNPFLQ